MTARTLPALGLGVALAFSLGACGVVDSTSAKEKPKTPLQILTESVPDEKSAVYAFAIKGGSQPATGLIDATHKAMQFSIEQKNTNPTFTMSMTMLVIDTKVYTKISFKPFLTGMPKLPSGWMSLDETKTKDVTYQNESDPGSSMAVFQNSAGLTSPSTGTYAGTVDLSKADEADIVTADELKALGTAAGTVPFTAEVDGQGRLSKLTVKVPAAGKYKASEYEVSYSGYGTEKAPAAPADAVAAPSTVYEWLNG